MKKKFYITNEISNTGNDFLRRALGTTWIKVSSSAGYFDGRPQNDFEYINHEGFGLGDTATLHEDMRGHSVTVATIVQPEEKYKIFDNIKINPVRIEKINKITAIPNIKIPVRISANPDFAKSDKTWNKIFMGGVSGETLYPRLIDQETVFYDLAFDFSTHDLYKNYNILVNEYGLTPPGGRGSAKITAVYNDYNNNIENYQLWAADKHELLLPNINFEASYLNNTTVSWSAVGPDWPISHNRKYWSSSPTYQNLFKYYYPKEIGAEMMYFADSIEALHSPAEYLGIPNVSWYGQSWIHNWHAPLELKDKVIRHQRNIMFPASYKKMFIDVITADPYGINTADMFNITIEFDRHIDFSKNEEALDAAHDADPDLDFGSNNRTIGSSSPGAPKNIFWNFRDSMLQHGFDIKFLETLKDIDSGALSKFKTEKLNLKATTEILELHELADGGPHRPWMQMLKKNVDNIKLESFNLLDLLAHLYNEPSEAINDDYTVIMDHDQHDKVATAMTGGDNLLYRFANNANITSVLSDVITMLKEYFSFNGAPLDSVSPGYEPSLQKLVYENMFNIQKQYSEVLAYKIEKHGGAPSGDSQTQNHLQNFWFFNAGEEPTIVLKDTQVKYGKEYTYKAYAYVAVISHKYKYSDLRLTRQINQYDLDNFEGPDKYCLQFYDPLTQQVAPQIYAISNAPEKNPEEAVYSNLSEYNTFAPAEYDIETSPQIADFYLNIEPCVKIIKIPIFEKKVGVFDSPDGKISNIPFYVINDDNKIGFSTLKDSFKEDTYPSVITDADVILKKQYLNSRAMRDTQLVKTYPEAPARYLEVYRSIKKPKAYTDFKNNLVSKIDLRLPGELYNRTEYNLFDKLMPNKKYYYLMRMVTENGMPGHPSVIIEAELVSDGGYKYAKFDTIDTSDFLVSDLTGKTTSFKKLFQIQPNINQLSLDTNGVDFTKTASTQMDNVMVGPPENTLWNKIFKIRLTSKKTGKKTDLNVTFNIQEKDFS